MKQLTVRGFDAELQDRLKRLAREEGISLNRAALRLLRKGAGLGQRGGSTDVVGDSLDDIIGSWSEDDERRFLNVVKTFDQVDEELWR